MPPGRVALLVWRFASSFLALAVVGCGPSYVCGDTPAESRDASVAVRPTPEPDAGIKAPTPDAGEAQPDGGLVAVDAGEADDAGTSDAGASPRDGGDPTWMNQPTLQPRMLSTDGQFLYWTTASSVHACALEDRCAAPIDLGTNEPMPLALAVDGTNVYWTTTDNTNGRGSVRYRARSGAGAVATVATNQQSPRCVAGGNGFVFWCTSQANQNRNIHRAQLDGNNEVAIDSGSSGVASMVLERSAAQLVWSQANGDISSITLGFQPGQQRMNYDTPLLSAPNFSIAQDGYVYWIEGRNGAGGGRIVRRRFAPPGPTEVIFRGGGTLAPKALTVSGRNLYFTAAADGATPSQLYHLALGGIPVGNEGLTPRLRATSGDFDGVVAVNGYLFVADPTNGRILRILE